MPEIAIRAVPREVTAVAGCSCGGLGAHLGDCTLLGLPFEVAQAAIDAAWARLDTYTAYLNSEVTGV